MKIIFFNHFHRGDLHAGKEYVKQIMREMPKESTFSYLHNNPDSITNEYGVEHIGSPNHLNKHEPFYQDNQTLYINTWMANDWDIFCKYGGGNMLTLHEMWRKAYSTINDFFNLDIKINDSIEYYIPEIDYTKIDTQYITNVDEFISDILGRKILICNNIPMSNQSFYSDMQEVITSAALEHPDDIFVCTTKFNTSIDNIKFTDDIIGNISGCDLHEISYLSTKCNIIVGKNSGPSTYCETKENLNNPKKYFLSYNIKNPNYSDIRESIAYGIKFYAKYKIIGINSAHLDESDRESIKNSFHEMLK